MTAFNPYAAPEADVDEPPRIAEAGGGLWRDGRILVMRKTAVLPDVCYVCNAPAGGVTLRRKLTWHPPLWYLTVLLNLLVYLIVALIVRKRADIRVGLCRAHRSRRWACMAVGWLVFLAALVLPFLTGFVNPDAVAPSLIGTVVMILAAGIISIYGVTIVRARRIDDEYAWLTGASPALLATLPEWQGRST